jgi:hypothetical protein
LIDIKVENALKEIEEISHHFFLVDTNAAKYKGVERILMYLGQTNLIPIFRAKMNIMR